MNEIEAMNAAFENRVHFLLIVEDDPLMQESLEALLQFAGYNVLVVSSPKEALKILQAAHPKLIIYDILEPNMDSRDLFTAACSVSKPIPFLFVSGQEVTNLLLDYQQLDRICYLTKPFNAPEFLKMVETLLAE